MRRFLLLTLATGCGITFAPGDFSGPGENSPPANDGGAGSDTGIGISDGGAESSTTNEGGPSPASLHVILLSGLKENAETNDVWTAPVAPNGDLGAFGYLQPTPLTKAHQTVALSNGRLLSVVQGSSSRIVQTAELRDGTLAPWTTAVVPNPTPSSYGSFFAKTSLVVVGGQTSEQVDDGMGGTTTVTTNHVDLLVNKATGAQYPAPNNQASTTKLPAGMHSATSVFYKDFVYLWGPGDGSDAASKVYVGKADETLGLASVTATAPMVTEPDKPHTPGSPIACAGAGRLFVIGGTSSAVTVSADINESSGALGTWKSGPALPAARSAGACAVLNGFVYVFGGAPNGDAKKATDEILRSKLSSDGSMTEWEKTAQKLIGPRANVFALTY